MTQKRSTQFTIFASLVLFVMILVSKETITTPDKTAPAPSAEKTPPPEPVARRSRTGPRSPPNLKSQGNPRQDMRSTDAKPQSDEHQRDTGSAQETEKLAVYLEHLEVLDNPSVDELTMLGELAFEANVPSAAYDHYLEVIDHHRTDPLAPFALYKLAWTEFNLGDVEAAIADMELMLEWLEVGDSPMENTLRAAGPTDLAMFIEKAQ